MFSSLLMKKDLHIESLQAIFFLHWQKIVKFCFQSFEKQDYSKVIRPLNHLYSHYDVKHFY